jgi:hypothetical protein
MWKSETRPSAFHWRYVHATNAATTTLFLHQYIVVDSLSRLWPATQSRNTRQTLSS